MPDPSTSISNLLPTNQSISSHAIFTSFQPPHNLGAEPPATCFATQPHYTFRWRIGEPYFSAIHRLQSERQAIYNQENHDQLLRLYLNDINYVNHYYGLPEVPDLQFLQCPHRQLVEPAGSYRTWTLADAYRKAMARAGGISAAQIALAAPSTSTQEKVTRTAPEPEPMCFQHTPSPAHGREQTGSNTVFFVDGHLLILGGVSPKTTELKVSRILILEEWRCKFPTTNKRVGTNAAGRRGLTLPVDANTGQILGWVVVEFASNEEAWKALAMVSA
ncbi:hypothetical protein K440DRAFT_661091 [Wilcoxina mikolae CBS 423.85]|nr:hypothetical protein K440DRAFT_661091 [Wilcoxina mikolae CBS 423.85]